MESLLAYFSNIKLALAVEDKNRVAKSSVDIITDLNMESLALMLVYFQKVLIDKDACTYHADKLTPAITVTYISTSMGM